MGKGLFLGLLAGSLVSVAGLSVVSLMAPPLRDSGSAPEAVTASSDADASGSEPSTPEAGEVAVAAPETVTSPEPEPEAAAEVAPAEMAEPEAEVEPEAVAEAEPAGMAAPEPETELAMAADPADAQPEAPVVEAPAGSEFTRERPDEDPVAPAAEAAPESMDAPVVEAPAAETAPDLPEVTPAEAPESQSAAPEAIPAPDTTAPEALAEVPAAEQSVPVPPQGEAEAPELGQGAASDAALALVPEPESLPEIPASEVARNAQPEALPAVEPEPEEEQVAEAAPVIDPEPEMAPEEEAEAGEEPLPEAGAEDEQKPVIIGVGLQPRIGSDTGPQTGFSNSVPGVKINRLPSISGDTAEVPVVETEITPEIGEISAFQRRAVAIDNPDALPLIGVVLTDPASGGVSAEALAGISQPVTVAIDPTRADAVERAAALRAAGIEIAILVPELPAGATASDLEVSYQAFTQALPDAVAIIGAPDAPFQSDRRMAQHVVALLASDGRGLVTYDRGLNPARQAAESKDVPNAVVYRQLDARGESRLTMRRYLDRAAFEAAQTGQVLVVAEASPEAVAALSDWTISGAKDTLVAPVSALMVPAEE
ncbi:MAG: divergent polysaccharide deacetylase family protein [Albidovulum sp.]|uniref:divergent polysaccharide deacetylase family protein n=1 Tax=Albidovulum sp. TaxID=1872424 RepID=UPI003C806716